MSDPDTRDRLMGLFGLMHGHFGDPGWWPAKTRFEVMVGVVLTQQTTWKNVEKAIGNLEVKGLLTQDEGRSIGELASCDFREMIRCTGYYNQKYSRLRGLCAFILDQWSGDLDAFFNRPVDIIRDELLGLKGIGKETADSILLYAGGKPVFVIDAYTFRLMDRLGIYCSEVKMDYDAAQRFFMNNLVDGAVVNFVNSTVGNPADVALENFAKDVAASGQVTGYAGDIVKFYQDFHALIVLTAKGFCRKKPICDKCPLQRRCTSVKETPGAN